MDIYIKHASNKIHNYKLLIIYIILGKYVNILCDIHLFIRLYISV